MRRTFVTFFVAVVVAGCAQIIGAGEPHELALRAEDGGVTPSVAVPDPVDPNACPPEQKRCNGACVDKDLPQYGCASESCEPCSVPNAATLKCESGKCAFGTCKDGWLGCGPATEGCTSSNTAPQTCGSCGENCSGSFPACTSTGCAAACPADTTNCSNSCVDTMTSALHCGGCSQACTAGANGDPVCSQGKCTTECRPGFAHCDGDDNGDCVALTVFYRDSDADGYGDTKSTKLACNGAVAGAGWVAVAGDCNDANKYVHPGQKAYFDTPYPGATNGAPSYDYDCDGVEISGGQILLGCSGDCSQRGYTPAGSGRSGPGVNDYCGSKQYASCSDVSQIPQNPAAVHPLAGTPQCAANISAAAANGCH